MAVLLAAVVVGALAATFIIGAIGAEKKGMPGSFKRLFGKKNNYTQRKRKLLERTTQIQIQLLIHAYQ